ncbi:MAG: hypothetical protein RLZZ157_94 [Pseudomonadota bacterium]|jgi:hypothetical protein
MPIFIPEFQERENAEIGRKPARVSDGRDQTTRRDIFAAARQEAIYRGNLDAEQQRYREAYRKRIAALVPVTGTPRGPLAGLRNPEDIWEENRQAARIQGNAFTIKQQRRVFAQTLDQLARTRKDLDPRLTAPIEDDVRAIGLGVSERLAELKDRRSVQSESLLGKLDTELAALAGGFVGSLSDPTALPQFIAGVLTGGTSLAGTSVAKQVLLTGAREAAIGASIEASVQGVRQANEKALGQNYGAKEAAMAIGGAALGGAVIGGAGEALGAGVRKVLTGRALPLNEPAIIETAPNGQRALPAPLARMIEGADQNAPEAAPASIVGDTGNVASAPAPVPDAPIPDDGVRPFGFVPPDTDRLADWEKAFEDAGAILPADMRAALGKIEAEQASIAASRQTPEPYAVPEADTVRAVEKAYVALEMGEPLPAPALPRRFAPLPEGADPSMPMHPDEALDAAAMWRNTGELPALAAGDPVLLDQIEALGRLSNATFDQVQRGELSDDLGAVIGELAWNRPDTHQDLARLLIEADVTDVGQARAMVADRLDELVPEAPMAFFTAPARRGETATSLGPAPEPVTLTRRANPVEAGSPAAVQQAKDAAAAGGLTDLQIAPIVNAVERPNAAPPVAAILDETPPDTGRTDFIDMVVDPDGILGDAENPGALTRGDAARVAARDDFLVERFRGCIIT